MPRPPSNAFERDRYISSCAIWNSYLATTNRIKDAGIAIAQ
jgi:hypothetical protein